MIYKGDINEQDFKNIQLSLKDKIDITKDFIPNKDIKVIAGIDIAYFNHNDIEYGACSVVLFDRYSKTIIEEIEALEEVVVPYIPGCLAFREIPVIKKALNTIKSHKIDLIVVDGNGILHPNKMGLASHLSLETGIPAMGIAKTYFSINGHKYISPIQKKGEFNDIYLNNEKVGLALNTVDNAKPIFISPGNGITFDTAYLITMEFSTKESRIPMLTRIPDINTRILRNKYKELLIKESSL